MVSEAVNHRVNGVGVARLRARSAHPDDGRHLLEGHAAPLHFELGEVRHRQAVGPRVVAEHLQTKTGEGDQRDRNPLRRGRAQEDATQVVGVLSASTLGWSRAFGIRRPFGDSFPLYSRQDRTALTVVPM